MKRVSSSRKSASDLRRLAALKDSEVVIDDDSPAWTPEMFARAMVKRGGLSSPRAKTLLSLRVDSDVVEWFRAQGRGYQSRMNALLRAYMDAHRHSRKRAG